MICKDHVVSGEEFELIYDPENEMLITSPRPEIEDLSSYYKSPDYISHTDSRSSLTDRIYQYIKSRMLKKKLGWIEKKVPAKGQLLDIGAGTGDFLFAAKKKGWKVEGIEPDAAARKRAREKGIQLVKTSEDLSAGKFDLITLWHVLEHVPDLKQQIEELQGMLKKNGLLVIAVPNFKSYDAEYYQQFWAAYDVPRHLWHFSRNSISQLFGPSGFKFVDSKPLWFDSFYVSLLSEKNKTGSNNFFKALKIGLISNLRAKTTSEYSSITYFFRKEDNSAL